MIKERPVLTNPDKDSTTDLMSLVDRWKRAKSSSETSGLVGGERGAPARAAVVGIGIRAFALVSTQSCMGRQKGEKASFQWAPFRPVFRRWSSAHDVRDVNALLNEPNTAFKSTHRQV